MITYYDILGLSPGAAPDQIRRSYRDLAKKNHPDLLQHTSIEERIKAEEKLKAINEAYSILSQPKQRSNYLFLMGTAQDPARKYTKLFYQKPADSPDEPAVPLDPLAPIHLKIHNSQNEISFLKSRFRIRHRRFWFGTAISTLIVFLIMWMQAVSVNMIDNLVWVHTLYYLFGFLGAELIGLPIIVNSASLRFRRYPVLRNPLIFSVTIFLGTAVACTSVIAPRTTTAPIEFPWAAGSLAVVMALGFHWFMVYHLAKMHKSAYRQQLQHLEDQIESFKSILENG